MKRETTEFIVGLFVIICFACIVVMTIKLGKLDLFNHSDYVLKAKFSSVSGLKNGATVEVSGIKVGKVTKLHLDSEEQVAIVELRLQNNIQVGDDVIASIKTSGIIGDKYIKLSPGASEDYLQDGDWITETEPAIDLEELISKYVFGDVK